MLDAANPELASLQYKLGGMSCSFCVNAIERGLRREKGVETVHVSLAHEEALIRYRPEETSEQRIKGVLNALGFLVRDPRKVGAFDEQLELKRKERNDLISAATFTVLLMLAMGAMWLGLWQMQEWHVWVAWAAATYVFCWNGRRIIRMAWGAARRGITNQHVLLSAGAIGGYAGGLLGASIPFLGWYGFVGFPAVDFFGVAVFLTTYHLLSGYVALIVRTRASESVRRLLSLQPETACVSRGGQEHEVPVEEVRIGERVRVRPGDRIPVDGVVEDGVSVVDQSLVTGEPIPEDKQSGAEVIGGRVNQTGTLVVRVTRVGEDSFLRPVARHVEEAKVMKPGIIILVDRVLLYYVPSVLGIAALALLFWGFAPVAWGGTMQWVTAIYAGVTVLVMGYPCALGMATPLALIRGGGMAAERGILMRSGEAFQVLKDINHVVFDKTDTLTEGRPRLVATDALWEFTEDEVLRLAASAEAPSEHPLARAIVEAAKTQGHEARATTDFEAMAGKGVRARVEDRLVLVGTPRLLEEHGLPAAPARACLETHEAAGHTTVLLAVDDRVAGVLAIADTIKQDAAEAIAALRERGVETVLVTGDNQRTTAAVARTVGITGVHAQCLPQDKVAVIRALQEQGSRVAMVGDGINDAPALMQAHVGIAIGAGTDVAIESADVVLMGRRLSAVPEAIGIGGNSYRKTVQNLWIAFFFNGVGVPLAATGLVHPSWAMAAMAASVSGVLANSFGGRLLQRAGGRPAASATETGATGHHAGGQAQVAFAVSGMHCQGCVDTIRAGLLMDAGITRVDGDPQSKAIRVHYDTTATTPEHIARSIDGLGFRVTSALEQHG
ncbi:heavy metal translocating P-type ATPase [Aquisalimonas sp.]|uniref:heavy metal translocating P-type ATPase n=1 Tax=Aquisalimonas sp. TaxID=1872621 RepID=UPI0025BFF7DC|nr:heavy metal translocating P-type ATPase [Aquisalimonas sp.]